MVSFETIKVTLMAQFNDILADQIKLGTVQLHGIATSYTQTEQHHTNEKHENSRVTRGNSNT